MRLARLALLGALGCASSHPRDAGNDAAPDAARQDAAGDGSASLDAAVLDADAAADDDPGCPPRPACMAPDADCDGHEAIDAGGDDCDDADASVHPGAPDGEWLFETLGEYPGINAAGLGMTWDAQDGPQLAWGTWGTEWGSEPGVLRVASRVDGGWVIDAPGVPADASRPWCCSVVSTLEDACGATLIGFARSTDSAEAVLHVLRGRDGAWTDEMVDEDAFESYGVLVLSASGTPHAVYMSNELRHARRQPDATWASERIDDAGYRPSVAVDGRGYFHVAYATPLDAPNEVRYATNSSGRWVATTVWSEGPVDLETAVAADPTGTPTVVYQDYADRGLVAARLTNEGWSESVVDADGGRNFTAAAALDGAVHVAYQVHRNLASKERIGSELRHAWSVEGAWSSELVTFESLYSASFPTLSVGPSAQIRIGYEVYEDPSTVHLALGSPPGDGLDQDCDGLAE